MSLLDEIKEKRQKLKSCQTTLTSVEGCKKVFHNGQIISMSKTTGFVIDTKPDNIPACILDNFLYLGSQDCVERSILDKYKINHVLSLGIETPPFENSENFTVKFIECLDLPKSNLDKVLRESNEFIEKCQNANGRILVHCNAGVSRSSSVVIGYLILMRNLEFNEAFDLVKSKRPCIQPNVGFVKQLKQLKRNF